MNATLRKLVFWGALFASLVFAVVVVNQILQLAEFGARVDPRLGDGIFWGLILILATSFAVPFVLLFRLPAPLIPPADDSGPDYERHLARLRQRLGSNPLLRERPLATRPEIEASLALLDVQATDVVKRAGSRAFLTTALSQNGALDVLLILGIQGRLVWDVSHVYFQRPTFRDMTYLYSNVLTTAFLAGEVDDAELSEAMQPALSAVMGSAAGVVPGLQVASTVFVNSVLSGTANAFLTLRVGVIAREYSRAVTRPQKGMVRRLAVVQAGGMLGSIAVAGAAKVSSAIGRATGKAVTGAITGAGRRIASTGGAIKDRIVFGRGASPGKEGEGDS
jgi:hypothetical protein